LVDYAGLFPPASEDMRPALERYASYLQSADRAALGRFIVPISRLRELAEAGADLMPRGRGSEPWRLSVLIAEDVGSAAEQMVKFNREHLAGSRDGHALIDVVELKATTADEIAHQRLDLPSSFTSYFEIPLTTDIQPLVQTIAKVGGRAKVRTGGVTRDAFPRASALVDFMSACHNESVPFKATAGLHHAVRGEYRLTYEPDSVTGMMYGFLNIFVAAVLLYAGESEETALSAVEETDASAFGFEDDAIEWRGKRLGTEQIVASRAEFAVAFGSCSFREPVDELTELTNRARTTDS
jgi:hypothetical protein